ncbi:transposase [Kutzneria kofuensis]|uniref:Transposase n=1 Tax=Kutzneria kofuensis TaxID=103725 RepID=A0A7W9NFJ3_9PSEU|nr:transposase [Kutzneria kofuensis]
MDPAALDRADVRSAPGRHERSGEGAARPPAFDEEIYKQRDTMEQAFNRLKQWRGIATRYDKYALTSSAASYSPQQS